MVPLGHWNEIRIRRLLWVTPPSSSTEFAHPDGLPERISHHAEIFARYRAALLAELRTDTHEDGSGPLRVFVDRPNGTRRYNRDEILRVVEPYGFVPVDLAQMPLEAQIAIFQQAEVVIGPSGAAWANLLFARRGLRGLYWVPEYLASTQTWSSLGAVADCMLTELTYPTPPGHSFFADSYVLPGSSLRAALDRL